MNYGFFIWFSDGNKFPFKYYAKYSFTEEEAIEEYRLEALKRGFKPSLREIRVATREDWERFDLHGDAWHSPNCRFSG